MSGFKVIDLTLTASVVESGITNIYTTDTVDLSTTDNTVINPNTNFTYIINNTTGDSVSLTIANGSYPGQQKTVIVTGGTANSNLQILYTNNYGTETNTNSFGTPGDIVQFVSSQKGWGIPYFDIK